MIQAVNRVIERDVMQKDSAGEKRREHSERPKMRTSHAKERL